MTVLLAAATLSGAALAADVFTGDGKVFSGVANERGEGLIVPQSLFVGSQQSLSGIFETETFGELAVVATSQSNASAVEMEAFPLAPANDLTVETHLIGPSIGWGVVPYLGVGVSSNPEARGVFQGIPSLLPYETETVGIQGMAGLSYELMPGVGAGLEYSFQTSTSNAPIPTGPSDNQTIMMRLDLGLN